LGRDLAGQIDKIIYDDPKIALTPPLVPGAIGVLDFVSKNRPHFLISRRQPPFMIPVKLLRRHGLWPKYFNEKNSFFVVTKEDKDEKAIELGINLYIDDQPSVLEKMPSVPNRFLLDLLGAYKDDIYYRKISSWSDFFKYI